MYRGPGTRQAAASMASAVVLLLLPGSGRALAQAGGAAPVTVTWDNGLSVTSGNGANVFQLGGAGAA